MTVLHFFHLKHCPGGIVIVKLIFIQVYAALTQISGTKLINHVDRMAETIDNLMNNFYVITTTYANL